MSTLLLGGWKCQMPWAPCGKLVTQSASSESECRIAANEPLGLPIETEIVVAMLYLPD
jgi:hypothetical protein